MKPQQANRNTRESRRDAEATAQRIAIIATGPKFRLGRVVITPGAISAFSDRFGLDATSRAADLLRRHANGDWGTVDKHDASANTAALRNGGRILSAYPLTADDSDHAAYTIWIVTEAEDDRRCRAYTTILLPCEY